MEMNSQEKNSRIKSVATTVKNPQTYFVECVYQTLGNMLRLHEFDEFEFDQQDHWSQILANCTWAIRSTIHSIINAAPAHIVFGREMLFDLSFTTEYKDIKKHIQEALDATIKRENSKRAKIEYELNNQVLLNKGILQRKLSPKRDGPHHIVRIYSNGILKIRKGIYVQRVSIRGVRSIYTNTTREANVVK
jgi:hypothetical protein